MATLNFRNLNKVYDNRVQAVFDFNLDIKDKEFIVFVGPSGCGKSTTLRMVAGLESITSGELYIDNILVNNMEPKDRNIAMVFQNYALYPHMTVYGNMAFALKLRKIPCPVYKENPEAEVLIEENQELIKKAKSLRKQSTKKKASPDLLPEASKLYDQILANHDRIVKMLSSDQEVGIYEEKIKELEKQIKDLDKEINRYQKFLEKGGYTEEATKALQEGVEQRLGQKAKLEKDLSYYLNNEVPLFHNRKLTKYEIDIEINRAAKILDLEKYLLRKPAALSGGQRQRVALGRAIVRNPKIFLMDEPLSNLDAKLRAQTRSEIINIHKRVNATTIYVTHDQVEAMTMADRIVIMRDGYIQQIGTPKEIYNDPANKFVAGFIGSPAMNFLDAHFDGKKVIVDSIDESKKDSLELTKEQIHMLKEHGYEGSDLILGVRPEKITLENKASKNSLKVKCKFTELLGYDSIIHVDVSGQELLFKCDSENDIKIGDELIIGFDNESFCFFSKETNVRIK